MALYVYAGPEHEVRVECSVVLSWLDPDLHTLTSNILLQAERHPLTRVRFQQLDPVGAPNVWTYQAEFVTGPPLRVNFTLAGPGDRDPICTPSGWDSSFDFCTVVGHLGVCGHFFPCIETKGLVSFDYRKL